MADHGVNRRLAAILAADVAGYTRLMEEDTDGTVSAWKNAREEVIKPGVADNHGKIVKLTGDGFLVEFPTVLDAVKCAVVLQEGLASNSLDFRMGVNMGDILDDGEDVYGEGVNIAARIESLAEPGGICISGSVHEQVRNRLDYQAHDMGKVAVKNVSEPVHVFRVLKKGEEPRKSRAQGGSVKKMTVALALSLAIIVVGSIYWQGLQGPASQTTRQVEVTAIQQSETTEEPAAVEKRRASIAVLPFVNIRGDKEQEYFSDGLTEDLITDISKVSGLAVIARNSTFAYKGQSPDVREVGKALGASYVVEGSVRKAGGTVRITVQLIDAADGKHLWAERYDRVLKDVFAIQDEVVGHIIKALSLKLTPQEKKRLSKRGTNNLQAYEFYMKGRQQESFFTKEAFVLARGFYEQAIDLDPEYAEPYAHLAQIHALNAQFAWVDNEEIAYQKALEVAEKSVKLNPEFPFGRLSLGRILVRPIFRQFKRAVEETEKAVELDPNFAASHAMLGLYYSYMG